MKETLLKAVIQRGCQGKVKGFSYYYQEALENYLYEKLCNHCLYIHDPRAIKNFLDELIQRVVLPVITSAERNYHQFGEAQIGRLDIALIKPLAQLDFQEQQTRDWLKSVHGLFHCLDSLDYATFLRQLNRLLSEIALVESDIEPVTVLIRLLINFSTQNKPAVEVIKSLGFAINSGDIFSVAEQSKHSKNLILLEEAIDNAILFNSISDEELLKDFADPMRLDQPAKNTSPAKTETMIVSDKAPYIRKQLYMQQCSDLIGKFFVEDILAFIDSRNTRNLLDSRRLISELKKFLKEHNFFALNGNNIRLVEEYVKKNIPAPIADFLQSEWETLFRLIAQQALSDVKQVLSEKEAEKEFTLKRQDSHSEIKLVINPEGLGTGAENIAYLATVTSQTGITSPLVCRVKKFSVEDTQKSDLEKNIDKKALTQIYQLRHPAIICTYSTTHGTELDHKAFHTDYLEFASRGELLDYPLNLEDLPKYFFAIIDGVKFLHTKNIAHLDLKPSNILLGDDGIPKITDFDTARNNDNKIAEQIGTFVYWPPEIKKQKPKSNFSHVNYLAIDVWALGVILYQLYTGEEPPYNEESHAFLGFKNSEGHAAFFHKNEQGAFTNSGAEKVAQVIEQLLTSDPGERLCNFNNIFQRDYFKEIKAEEVYPLLRQNVYLDLMHKENNDKLKKIDHAGSDKKITYYQEVIADYSTHVPVLSKEDEQSINDQVNISVIHLVNSSFLPGVQSEKEIKKRKSFAAEAEKKMRTKMQTKMLAYKKLQCEQAVETIKQDLIKLQKAASIEILGNVLKTLPVKNSEFIKQNIHQEGILLPDRNSVKQAWKKLKPLLKDLLKTKHSIGALNASDLQVLFKGVIENHEQIINLLEKDKTQNANNIILKDYLLAVELLNILLNLPDLQANPVLPQLYKSINEKIALISKCNPMAFLESDQKNKLSINYCDISDKLLASSKAGDTALNFTQWIRSTTRYCKYFFNLKKYRLKSLKEIDERVKDYLRHGSIEEKINNAIKLIDVCQEWLKDRHNTVKRFEVINLQSMTFSELNWLLGMKAVNLTTQSKQELLFTRPVERKPELKQKRISKVGRQHFIELFNTLAAVKNKIRNGFSNTKFRQGRAEAPKCEAK